MFHTPRRQCRCGFTLVEFLAVIVIITILAAILFPVFSRVRENARRAACQSNLKQIGLGFLQYAQDYDEKYPSSVCTANGNGVTGGWMYYTSFSDSSTPTNFNPALGTLYPYTKSAQICMCPSDALGKNNSYAMNGLFRMAPNASSCSLGNSLSPGVSLAAVRESSITILLMEESTGGHNSTDDGIIFPNVNPQAIRHSGGSNYAFVDGHAKFYSASRLSRNDFSATP